MPAKYTPEQRIRAFWAKVDKTPGHGPKGECWVWTASFGRDGYGRAWTDNGSAQAHRVAWELTSGSIPPGDWYGTTCVLHSCDNPPCVNPAHLWLGTVADNSADMVAKGRSPTGERHGSRTMPESVVRGSCHANAKLTEADIPDIRAALARKESYASIGRRYGVSWYSIWSIAHGRTWKHVPE